MRRTRRTSRTGVDLIGFLDILSAVMVIVLLVLAVLALSIGVQGSRQTAAKRPEPAAAAETAPPATRAAPPRVAITTVDGSDVTAATAFLLCKGDELHRFDPGTGERIGTWSLSAQSPAAVAQEVRSPNVYLAVAGTCFPSLEALVEAFRSSGSQLGYEPIAEEAVVPWQ